MRGAIHHSRCALVRATHGPAAPSSPDFSDPRSESRLQPAECDLNPSRARKLMAGRMPHRLKAELQAGESLLETTPPAAFPVSEPPLADPQAPYRLSPTPLAAPQAPFPLSETPLSAPQAPLPPSETPLSAPIMPFPKAKVRQSGTLLRPNFSKTSLKTSSYP